ncbi:MAG: 30S ribosomal protein S2 [Bacteroidota bacterium]|nr:30S ribosomal protein S2 [Bacteroidota bacterium]
MPKAASIQELLQSGAHFGHLTRRWNPKMKEFIFMQRNGIHIIDLKKTQNYLQEAIDEIQQLSRAGKTILFVGTKKQSTEIIRNEAVRAGMPYVTHRWLGGMLTNFATVRKSISRMEEIERMKTDGTFDELTKKERLMLSREQEKLENTLGGISNMNRLPGAIFVVDIQKEHLAVSEAIKLHIPIIAMVDTNSDPDVPDFIVPCNDDSARTIQLVTSQIADAIIEGAAEREAYEEEAYMEELVMDAKEETADEVEPKTKLRSRRKKKDTSKLETLEPQDTPAEKDTKDADFAEQASNNDGASEQAKSEDPTSEEKA